MRRTGLAAVGLVALVAALGTTGVAQADRGSGSGGSGGDNRTVRVRDDCDPASFNAALQDPEACVGDGDTLFQEASVSVCDTTYLGMLLKSAANGTSSPCCGQNSDHSPYRTRPIRKASVVSAPWPMIAPISSSK